MDLVKPASSYLELGLIDRATSIAVLIDNEWIQHAETSGNQTDYWFCLSPLVAGNQSAYWSCKPFFKFRTGVHSCLEQ